MFVTGRREFRAAQFLGIICRYSKNCFKEALRLAVVLLVGFQRCIGSLWRAL